MAQSSKIPDMSFYMPGKIHEQQVDTNKAIQHYEKFLDLWKDAYPGIIRVEDVKKRLTGLKREPARGVEPPTY